MKKFFINQLGGVSAIIALALPIVIIAMGAGVDLARAAKTRTDLTRAVESASLAAASLTSKVDQNTVVQEYIRSNLKDNNDLKDPPVINIDADVSLNARRFTVTATGKIDTYFLGLINIDTLEVSASATATEQIQEVEISMVLDISSSMRGQKLENLQIAAKEFVDTITQGAQGENTSINLVPFGGTVNVGDDIFERYAIPVALSEENPSEADYDIGDQVPEGEFRFTAFGVSPEGETCFEYEDRHFDNANQFDEDSLAQVPHFWKWNRFNPWCPDDVSAAIFNSNNVGLLKDQIDAFELSDGTGMNIGAMWGYRALSAEWQGQLGGDFADRPAPLTERALKVLVVMSDGNITAQFRPEDFRNHHVHTNRAVTTDTSLSQSGQHGNANNQQTILPQGNVNSDPNERTASSQFRRVCDLAKDDDILVFTIGFQVRENSLADNLLRDCASDEGKYFFVESLDISTAFRAIASAISALRIVG